ncbi:MAG TPA: ACT domain-containing protein [Ignavibacteria bacterium]
MNFEVLTGNYAIYRFGNASLLPDWIYSSGFYSITKTRDEISVVAAQNDLISSDIVCNKDWRIIKIKGPLDFSLVGIIADISAIFKRKKISVFTLSTYDTDYFLIKQKDLEVGIHALIENDHNITIEKKKASE